MSEHLDQRESCYAAQKEDRALKVIEDACRVIEERKAARGNGPPAAGQAGESMAQSIARLEHILKHPDEYDDDVLDEVFSTVERLEKLVGLAGSALYALRAQGRLVLGRSRR